MSSRKKGVIGRLLEKVVAGFTLAEKKEKKMSKKIIGGLIAVLVVVMMRGVVYADNPGTVNLTVTVSPSISVDVPRANYEFLTLGINTASVAAESTAVINDSADATQKYNIRASDAKGAIDWVLADAAAPDTYSLHVQFNSSRPGDFGSGDDNYNLTNADQTATATVFAGNQDGDDVAAGTELLLWFRINTPTSVGSTDEKTIYVTITAVIQG